MPIIGEENKDVFSPNRNGRPVKATRTTSMKTSYPSVAPDFDWRLQTRNRMVGSIVCGVLLGLWHLCSPTNFRVHQLFAAYILAIGSGVGCFWANRRLSVSQNKEGTQRETLYLLFGRLAPWLYLIALLISLGYTQLTGDLPFPSPSDLFFALSTLCIAVYGMQVLWERITPGDTVYRWQRVRLCLDALVLMVALITFSWCYLIGPTLMLATVPLGNRLMAAFYPLSVSMLACYALLLIASPQEREWRFVRGTWLFGLLLISLASCFYAYTRLHGYNGFGHFQDGFLLAGSLISSHTIYVSRFLTRQPPPPMREEDKSVPRLIILIPYALLPFVIGLNVYLSYHPLTHFLMSGVKMGSYSLVALILLRQALAMIENNALMNQLVVREGELRRARDRAEEASRTKAMFLANMSHEIRTPMNGILGMMQLLTQTPLNEEQLDFVETASSSAEALVSVINDILDFSKLEAGKMELESLPFNPGVLLQHVVTLFSVEAKKNGITLTLENEILLFPVKGDAHRLRQILNNLVGNAIKFTKTGGVTLSVFTEEIVLSETETSETEATENGKTLLMKIKVSDTGVGIPPERIDAVFASFTQADGSTTRRFGGTGLGLTISRQFAHLMGGEITVTSEVGVGSCFEMILPFAKADPVTLEVVSSPRPTQGSVQGLCLSVLLAEDNSVNQKVAKRMLERLGCRVTLADNGEEAVKFVCHSEAEFDLIFMDVQMPVLGGLEATQSIREWESKHALRPALPVIALTANAMEGDRAQCLEAGMNDYLAKPVHQGALQEMLVRYSLRAKAA